MKFTNNLS